MSGRHGILSGMAERSIFAKRGIVKGDQAEGRMKDLRRGPSFFVMLRHPENMPP